MKSIILVALALVAVAVAAPVEYQEPLKILRSDFSQEPEGSYQFAFETEDGIVRNENGEAKEALDEDNKPHKVIVVRGSYSYPGEDGKPVTINYVADEFGYRAEGDTVPKPQRR